jgi:serine/threonine protein kinase
LPPAGNAGWRGWLAGTPLARPPAPPAGNPPRPAGNSPRPAGNSPRPAGNPPRPAGNPPPAPAAGSSSRAGSPSASAPLAAEPGPLPTPARGAVVPKPRPPATLVESPNGASRRFDLVRQLGSGGFGGVWLAMDHRLGHRVAIKAAHVPDHDTELRIRREARALGAVAHPNCVRIIDLVDSQTDPGLARLRGLVIVMEYVDGRSLGELVAAQGPVDDLAAARIWLRTAGALAAAHQRGVLHRDVKPSNVVLDHRGEPHLIDFGIARARGDMTLTMHGMVIGTPDFLAPETARGDRATPASDAWQLAATISYALTGAPPRGDHPGAATGLRAAAFSTAPTHLPGHSVHRPLLAACLASEPTARPDLAEVRRALEQWLAGHQPPGAGQAVNLARGGQRARR